MRVKHLATGLAAGCLSLALGGCGSAAAPSASTTPVASNSPTPMTASAYRSVLHQVAQQQAAAQHRVEAAFHARTVAQVRSALATFARSQRRAGTELSALTPPADATTANAQLARAFTDNAGVTASLVSKLASATTVGQALGIVQNDPAGQKVGQKIDTALARLKALGYTAGS